MNFETVIGLEVHAELKTKTKIYCGCPNEFGGETNTHCCPICTGMPGVLPVLNKTVVDYAIKAADSVKGAPKVRRGRTGADAPPSPVSTRTDPAKTQRWA
ncbi:MAG: hypothetical protein IJC06_01685 [Clostridia bacterium]|nr:hypothetical protein [Clostridia bacterium]